MVLFASTLFTTKGNVDMVISDGHRRGVELTVKQAQTISHGFGEKLWVLHTWLGYGIAFLLLSRMVVEVVISKEERLRRRIKNALMFKTSNNVQKQDRLHYLFVKYVYLVFYLMILIMALTGLGLAFEDLPIFDKYHGPIKEVHEFTQWGIYAYIALHLGGVVWTDLTKHHGLISRMIHGKAA
jgi:cytochrome b